MTCVVQKHVPVLATLQLLDASAVEYALSRPKIHILCPFHDDNSPSCQVSEDSFICWACREKGSLYQFICKFSKLHLGKKLNEFEAMLWVASICNSEKWKESVKQQLVQVDEQTKEEKRLFAKLFIESFNEPYWEKLQYYKLAQRFSSDTLRQFGVRINTHSNHPNLIPIYQQDRFMGYAARREQDDIEPKYMYNPGFRASEVVGTVYGHPLKRGPVLFVEGYSDAMRAFEYQWTNTAVLFGSECSKAQADFISFYATAIISGADNDSAGRKLEEKVFSFFPEIPKFRMIKNVKDVDLMSRNQFQKAIAFVEEMMLA